jgi:hypothetical protein
VSTRERVLASLGGVLLLVAIGTCFCIAYRFLPPDSRITDDYYLLRSSTYGTSIGATWTDPGTIQIIGPEIVDLDWNEEFIVVKQIRRDEQSTSDGAVINWYIIEVEKHRPLGSTPDPLSYDEYLETRKALSIPNDLDLLKPDQESWIAYKARRKQNK